MMKQKIDLSAITDEGVSLLAGQPRGVAAREKLRLDDLDKATESVEIFIPPYVSAITTSFVQGLFGDSARLFKNKLAVTAHYDISALPEGIREDINSGLDRLFFRRQLP